jgi:hypothetical protein
VAAASGESSVARERVLDVAEALLAILDAVAFAEGRGYGEHDQRARAHTMIDVLVDGLAVSDARLG